MFVEWVLDKEFIEVFFALAKKVANVDDYASFVKNVKFSRYTSISKVTITLPTKYSQIECSFFDYNVHLSYSHSDYSFKALLPYRKFMYKKFGEEYFKHLKQYVQSSKDFDINSIDSQIDKLIEQRRLINMQVNNEVNNLKQVKGEHIK